MICSSRASWRSQRSSMSLCDALLMFFSSRHLYEYRICHRGLLTAARASKPAFSPKTQVHLWDEAGLLTAARSAPTPSTVAPLHHPPVAALHHPPVAALHARSARCAPAPSAVGALRARSREQARFLSENAGPSMGRGGLAHCRSQRPYTIRPLRPCTIRPLRPYTIRLLRRCTIHRCSAARTVRPLRPYTILRCAPTPSARCGPTPSARCGAAPSTRCAPTPSAVGALRLPP